KMDWDHDVCLSCDRQTPDGEKFCSQACRLLDLERAGRFSDTPATLPLSAPSWMSWQIPSTTNRSQFQLAPPVNFSAYRQSAQAHSPPSSPKNKSSARDSTSGYFQAHSSSFAQSSQRGLTSSPSRSSLSSVSSSSTSSTVSTPGLTTEAMNQLRSYSGAFDTTRDWKRRVTLG
ncbi:hypothetical protein EJ08DRAFT_598277, partial [Tothia fuscella]